MVHWIVDGLPAAMRVTFVNQIPGDFFEVGFPLGVDVVDPTNDKRKLFYLYNHVRMRISVHSNPEVFDGYRVVRFEVEPFSVKHVKVLFFLPNMCVRATHRLFLFQMLDSKDPLEVKTCNEKVKITHDLAPQPIGTSDSDTDKTEEEVCFLSHQFHALKEPYTNTFSLSLSCRYSGLTMSNGCLVTFLGLRAGMFSSTALPKIPSIGFRSSTRS